MSTDLKAILSRLHSTAAVLGGLPELPGYNGSILKIDDVEAARCVADINAAIALLVAATPTRTEFEAAAYQYIKTIEGQMLIVDLIRNKGSVEFDTAIAAAMGWPTVPEQGDEVARLRAVVDAAQEWSADRPISDWSEADLLKALWTFNGDTIEPCPECDGECGEPCAPCTVAEAHAAIDATLDDLVKRGKLYRGDAILPPAPIPNFCGVCNKTRDPNCAKCGQWSAAPTVPEVKS